MSLLARTRISHLRAAASRFPVAVMAGISSTSQASSSWQTDIEIDPFAYSVTDKFTPHSIRSKAKDDLPPAAPATAYGPPKPTPPNPFRETSGVTPSATRPCYRMYVKATRNNCIITLTKPDGNPLRTFSGGMYGFKHVNRSTHEAAHQCAVHAFENIKQVSNKEPNMLVHLYLNGFGKGREAVQKAFLSTEGDAIRDLVFRVTDKTSIPIGGNRAKKRRRL